MERITTDTAVAGLFTDGNPDTLTPPTSLNAKWFNDVQEELVNVILGARMALDGGVRTQLLSAITRISGGEETVGEYGEYNVKNVWDPQYEREPHGDTLSRTHYAELWAYVSHADNAAWLAADGAAKLAAPWKWGPGDGATTFQMPDLEGMFLRIRGGPLAPAEGVFKANQNKSHDHDILVTDQDPNGTKVANASPGGTYTASTELDGGDESNPDHIVSYKTIRLARRSAVVINPADYAAFDADAFWQINLRTAEQRFLTGTSILASHSDAVAMGLLSATRASSATAVTVAGGVSTVGVNALQMTDKGSLVEASGTNNLPASEDLSDVAWTLLDATTTANAVAAPDGTVTADKLVENSANTTHGIKQDYNVSDSRITLSFFAKAAEKTVISCQISNLATGVAAAVFNLATGLVTAELTGGDFSDTVASMQPLANGWYRCILTTTKGSYNTVASPYIFLGAGGVGTTNLGNGVDGLYLWGPQLEVSDSATSYIKTTSSSAARPATSLVLKPKPGRYNITAKFSDGTTQAVAAGVLITASGYTVPPLGSFGGKHLTALKGVLA